MNHAGGTKIKGWQEVGEGSWRVTGEALLSCVAGENDWRRRGDYERDGWRKMEADAMVASDCMGEGGILLRHQ